MKKSIVVLPLALLALALALTACGGGSSSSGGGEEAAIVEAIEESGTSTDPSKCSEFQTEAFNEAEEPEASNPLKSCEEETEEDETPAESIDVSSVEENGESATADAAVTGSALNGQTVELELVKEKGDWKLNKFLGFAKYDPTALGEGLEETLEKEAEVSPALAKCVSEGVAEASQSEAEAMVFEKNLEKVQELAESCE